MSYHFKNEYVLRFDKFLENLIFEKDNKSWIMTSNIIERPPRTIQEVFNNLPEGTLAQLIENDIVMSPSPLFMHQKALDKIYRKIGNFVEDNGLGQTLCAPMDVFLEKKNIFHPDILFIGKERLHLIEEDGIHGAPDLIIEILSPSTAKYDLEEKNDVYERCGVSEYWVVDPATNSTEGYFLKKRTFVLIEKNKNVINSRLFKTAFHFR